MKTPVVVDDGGDVEIYDTAEAAAFEMEAIDVLDGAYVTYDSDGTILEASAASIDSPVTIRMPADPSKDPEKLENLLRTFVRRVGLSRFGLSEQELQQFDLSKLIDAVHKFQDR